MSRDPKEPPFNLLATIGVAENAASVGRSTMGSQATESDSDTLDGLFQTAELEIKNQAYFL
jgi:hypothetical protein